MKVKTLALAAGAGLLLAGTASADLNLVTELHNQGNTGDWGPFSDQDVDVYRLYASSNDGFIVAAWGNPLEDFTIKNVLADGETLGAGFFKPGSQASTLPVPDGYTYNGQPGPKAHDNSTWLTIGLEAGYTDSPAVWQEIPESNSNLGSPGFSDADYASTGGVVNNPGDPVGNSVAQFDNDSGEFRLLLAQFSVQAGTHVVGENILVAWQNADGTPQDDKMGLSFATLPLPAPGAFALLGLAGLAGTRRRRA